MSFVRQTQSSKLVKDNQRLVVIYHKKREIAKRSLFFYKQGGALRRLALFGFYILSETCIAIE